MINRESISRRKFIQVIGNTVSLLFVGIWFMVTKRTGYLEPKQSIVLSASLIADGITVFDQVIANRHGETLHFFNSKCTHLGCQVRYDGQAHLVCPCHGSAFDPGTGNPLRGPAMVPLRPLDYTWDREKGTVTIYFV